MIAEIIINSNVKNLNKVFDYIVPEEQEEEILVGNRVLVPFGNSKRLEEGFVVGLKEESKFANKEISKIENQNGITKEQIQLAWYMSERYFCNVADCIKLMLQPGTSTKKIENRIREKTGNFVYLKKEMEEIEFEIELGNIKNPKHLRIIEFVKENEGISISDLEVLTETSRAMIKTLEKRGLIEIVEEKIERNPFVHKVIQKDVALSLTLEQKLAFDTIREAIENNEYSQSLLYGVTGSGKTEVYLQLIKEVLQKGKAAIMLVPEISLTPQMVDRFLARFGENTVAVLHSKLSVGERYDQWQKIKSGKCKIVIGARSAIFAPVQNLGIIIIDEEHDSSYKSDMAPRYQAKEIAEKIAKDCQIPLVLGSATPDINTFYRAKEGEIQLLTLSKRANHSELPEVSIIDLREELASGNKSMLSYPLYENMKENLKEKKQTILFLNRRGYSTFVMCRDCGYTIKCKNCNITLTYHLKENRFKCHYCGYEQKAVTICPECGSKRIKYFGTGTQKLEAEVKKIFPEASTIRMDIDTVSKKNSHEKILNQFKKDNIDVLIGTQMVVKGHHFPNVTLVGVIAADSSLNIDDYRANERTFQTLVQVAGRSGREQPGKVIIQTYNPDNFSIEYAKKQNYDLFYQTEIGLRKQLKYPPFCDIIVIGVSGTEEQEVIELSNQLYEILQKEEKKENFMLYKPVPYPIDKIKNRHRWRMILKCKFDHKMIKIVNNMLKQYYKMKYKNARVIVDVNPTSMM